MIPMPTTCILLASHSTRSITSNETFFFIGLLATIARKHVSLKPHRSSPLGIEREKIFHRCQREIVCASHSCERATKRRGIQVICHLQRFFAELTRDPFNAFPTEWCIILPLFFFFPRESKRYLFFTFVRICHWIEWELEMRDHEQILKKTLTIISYISCNPCFYKKGLQYCYNLYSTFI